MFKTPSLQELLEAGVHFGHQVRHGHPRMRTYIYGAKEGVHIIDLTKSDQFLKEACEFLYNLGKENKVLLFVGTKKQAREIIEEAAKKVLSPFFTERWVGGFLTNFDEVLKNIKKLKTLKEQKDKGELKKYTKKEQLLIDRKISNLEKDYKGVVDLETLPDAIFVIDAVSDNIAIREAKRMGITIVAIADSNANPQEIDYPIPGNDDAIKSIKLLVETVTQGFEEGKKEAGKIKVAEEKREEKRKAQEAEDLASGKIADEVAVAEEDIEKVVLQESERKV